MKKTLIMLLSLLAFTLNTSAQVEIPKDTPQLEFVMQLKVTLGEAYSCGETQQPPVRNRLKAMMTVTIHPQGIA